MDITIAYFHPLLHPETVKRDFDRIRAVGAGSIVYAVYEQEEQRQRRDLALEFWPLWQPVRRAIAHAELVYLPAPALSRDG